MRRLMLGSLLAVATAALLIPVFAPTATNAATLERIETSRELSEADRGQLQAAMTELAATLAPGAAAA